jgi:CDP-diacylglycerol--serine O-phosphatidyltransferase
MGNMPDDNATSESERMPELSASGRGLPIPGESGRYGSPGTSRRRKRQRMPGLAMLPTALTLGNAVCGVAALIELAKAYAAIGANQPNEVILRITYAAALIGVGMLFDALDGKVARMTSTTGRFGAELDSLCDAITFGVTPALMIRVGGEFFFARPPFGFAFDTKLLWAISGLFACCAILRLARYNVETNEGDDHTQFLGLPSPAAAASICSVMLGCIWLHQHVDNLDEQPWPWILRFALPAASVLISLVMVSRVRYVHLFNRLVSRKQSFGMMVLFLLIAAAAVMLYEQWQLIIPVLMLTYVLSGPVYFAYRFLRGRGLLGRRLALAELKRRRVEEHAKEKARQNAEPRKDSATTPA